MTDLEVVDALNADIGEDYLDSFTSPFDLSPVLQCWSFVIFALLEICFQMNLCLRSIPVVP